MSTAVTVCGCIATLLHADSNAPSSIAAAVVPRAVTDEVCGGPHPTSPLPVQPDFVRGIHIGTTVDVNKNAAANVPRQFIDHVQSLNANWIGVMQALHVDDSLDPTVEANIGDPYFASYTDAVSGSIRLQGRNTTALSVTRSIARVL